ncbi:MAG: serine--tRNA ligase [Dehalococcoidia bacterium]
MLSIELIRHDPDSVHQALLRRGEEASINRVLELDTRRRELVHQGDTLRARRNQVSQEIGRMETKPEELIEEMRQLGDRIKEVVQGTKALEEELHALLLTLPNLPLERVPSGSDDSQNVLVRTWGEPRSFDFTPLPHWELGERLGILDLPRGAKLSGSRFFVLSDLGARLERALIWWFLEVHTQEHGYREVSPPYLVKREVMVGSGNLPKFGDNLYHDEEDDLWLIPTAEVPLTSLHRDEVLEPGTLPLSYVAYTPCFRKEKVAAGRDVRGIKRVHQFDKVELYKFVEPERSDEELQRLVADAESLCQRLEVPHRVVELCAGELGFPSARSYDLEMWAPGSGEWLEVSSCSNCTDFQARRANIRYRPRPGARPQYVHTLNGSGLALPRVVIAILETYQQPDGSVVVPEVLRPYTGSDVIAPEGRRG